MNYYQSDEYKKKMAEADAYWLKQAQEEYPDGTVCFFCGEENDFADDCGFFYLTPDGPGTLTANRPACKACYDGEPGSKHKERYGVGER